MWVPMETAIGQSKEKWYPLPIKALVDLKSCAIWDTWGRGWGKSELTCLHRQLVDWVCVIGWINVDSIGGLLDALQIDDAGLHHHHHIVTISARNCCHLLALCTWWVK